MVWCGFLLPELDGILIEYITVEGFDPLGKIMSIQGVEQLLYELLVATIHQITELPDKTDTDD